MYLPFFRALVYLLIASGTFYFLVDYLWLVLVFCWVFFGVKETQPGHKKFGGVFPVIAKF